MLSKIRKIWGFSGFTPSEVSRQGRLPHPCLAGRQVGWGLLTGFTLMELLVVVTIIVILAAMLAPSLQKAREMARKTVCISNQRQMGLAFWMYVNDYDGWWPDGDSGEWGGDDIWPELFVELGYIPGLPRNHKITWCPSDMLLNSTRLWYGSYLYNNDVFSDAGLDLIKDSRITAPSKTAVLFEGHWVSIWTNTITYRLGTGEAICWHNEGMNILFCDGHVKWYKREDITNDMQTVVR